MRIESHYFISSSCLGLFPRKEAETINQKKSLVNVTFIVPQNLLSRHTARLASVGQSDSCTTPHPHATLPPRMGFVHRGKGQLRRTAGHSLGGPNLPPWHASLPVPTLSTPVL